MHANPSGPHTLIRAFVVTVVVAIVGTSPVALGACSKGGGGDATAPASQCGDAQFDNRAQIAFALGCNSVSVSLSGVTYDQFNRPTSYNYDFSCSGGSNRKTGRVYNITWNNLGQALTWDFTVNGSQCRKS